MYKYEVKEVLPLVERTLFALLTAAPMKGREGAALRRAVDETTVLAEKLLLDDSIALWFDGCFELARLAGVTRPAFGSIRTYIGEFNVVSAGAITIKNALLLLTLAMEGRTIADLTFVSRWQVDDLKIEMNEAFPPIENAIADSLDSMTYRAVITLRATITNYLFDTARPLPQMLRYQFASSMPSLVLSHKLYGTAARADEIRGENKIVHPAFCPRQGRALSR